jgi:hypothetical protein
MCRETGMLHFFVNGVDQGAAASNIPERVYGVIDLYGQAAQATIVDTLDCYSPDTVNSSLSNTTVYRLSCLCLAHVVTLWFVFVSFLILILAVLSHSLSMIIPASEPSASKYNDCYVVCLSPTYSLYDTPGLLTTLTVAGQWNL